MKNYFKNKKRSTFVLICLFFNITNISFSQVNWVGGVDTDFYNVNNWDDPSIDFSNIQSVTLNINPGSPNNPIQSGGNAGNINYRPGRLNMSAGANATFNGILLPWGSDYINGDLTLNSPADINIRSAVYLGNITDGTINLNGGNLHSKNAFYVGYNDGGNGTINVLGGTLYVGSYLEVATSPSGTNPTGTLNISGGIVEVPNGVNIGINGSIHISNLGALIVTGDHTISLNDYVSAGKITSPVSTTLEVVFDGSKTTVALSQNPNSLITEYASYIILDSGPLQARIDKGSGEIKSLIVNGKETVATSNPANSGRVGTYYDLTSSDTSGNFLYERFGGANFTIKEETVDYIDVSFKRDYAPGKGACDMDIHYVLKKNDTGIYTYSILTHKPEYPDFPLGSWRQVLWLGNDGSNYLTEKIYVTDKKNWEMPNLYDWSQAESSGIQEFSKLTTGVQAGQYDGKYEYCENLYELPVYGHASDVNAIGTWAIFGSHEFFPAGPTSHDLNAAAGIIHMDMTNVHYNSRQIFIPTGEEWSKIYGPYLWYTSEKPTGDENWADAKTRAEQDKAEWPFAWLTDTPEYPLADGRGNIVGSFSITDSAKPEIDGSNAWIGVTQLSDRSDGDWQFEDKNYQYWVKTDASGNFDIQHVRPGTYTLFAFKDGEIDEYRKEAVTVTAGGTTNLGNLNWTIARNNGNLVWEIGVPNRTTTDFKLGDLTDDYVSGDVVYSEGHAQLSFKDFFPNPIEYNVADGNWSDIIPYAHTKYYLADGTPQAWDWNFNFDLTGDIPTTGNAKLTVAFASADYAQLWMKVNGSYFYQTYLNGVPTGGNALIRQSNHAKYGIQTFDIPYNKLKIGNNTITLLMPSNQNPSHLMYDYISLEGDLTATLSLNELPIEKTIKVFPNPSNSIFNVLLPNTINEVTTELYSISGSLVYSQKHNNIHNSLKLDISSKPDGIYFLRIIGDEPVTIKIIKK